MGDAPMQRVRRVISGENDEGRAVFPVIEEVAPIKHFGDFYGVWGWDTAPELPFMASEGYVATSVHPPAGGVRVNIVEFPPGRGMKGKESLETLSPERRAGRAEFEQLLFNDRSNYTDSGDVESTGLHRTDSIDICFVLSGKMTMALDDGAEELLQQGDCYIQVGTMHNYKNPFDEPCYMGIVVLPASRSS